MFRPISRRAFLMATTTATTATIATTLALHTHHRQHPTTTTTTTTSPFTVFAASKATTTTKTTPTPLQKTIAQADTLFDQGQESAPQLYALLQSTLATERTNGNKDPHVQAELLWRLARAARLLSIDVQRGSKDERKKFAFETLELAQEAAQIDPGNWAAHKWIAVGYKVVGDHVDTKSKLKNSFLIRDEFVRALDLNPSDATTTCLLGQWHYYFADMPWYERQAASLLFAAPPSSTYDEALKLFLKAEQLDPGFYKKNAQMLASTYYRLGKYDDAKKWKQTALAMPTKTLDDEEAHQQALKINA
jgi:tetratricopeptide (TPR) repeat protein